MKNSGGIFKNVYPQVYPPMFRKVVLAIPLKVLEPKAKASGNSNFFLITSEKSISLVTLEISCQFAFFLEQPNFREGTGNKLKTFFATRYKSHLSKEENKNSG